MLGVFYTRGMPKSTTGGRPAEEEKAPGEANGDAGGKPLKTLMAESADRDQRALADLWRSSEAVAALAPRVAVLLAGSTATEFADGHSGVDLVVISADEHWGEVARALDPAGRLAPGEFRPCTLAGGRAKLGAWPSGELDRLLAAWDDGALYCLQSARVLHDPAGLAGGLLTRAAAVPDAVWAAKAASCYRCFRQRKASLAWSLRRGQPFVCLDNLTQLLSHALHLCYYLEGKPPANRKWLFRGALRTRAGQRLRPALYELFTSLGDIAVLGGSYSLRHNRLYSQLTRLQQQMEAAMRERGWQAGLPGPARSAARSGPVGAGYGS